MMSDLLLGAVSWLCSVDTPGWLSFLQMVESRDYCVLIVLCLFPNVSQHVPRCVFGAIQAVLWGCALIPCVLTGSSVITSEIIGQTHIRYQFSNGS